MGTNRKLPFGYRMDFGRIAVQPEEARWVRYIFSQYNQGMPFSAITDKMRNSSMPYDGDKQWNKNMIARILEDHRYCGDREYPEIIDGATFQQTAERRKKKSAPRRQTEAQSALRKKCAGKMTPYIEHEVLYLLNCLPMYLIQNNHPAVISRDVYQAVQAEKARRSASASPSKKTSSTGRTCYASKFVLSERLVCGECGTLYRRCTWKRNGKTRIVWRCVSRLDYGTKYCHQSSTMDEEPLQRAIMAAVNSIMDSREKINGLITDAALEETGKLPNSAMTLGDINRRLEELEAEFNALFNQSGGIDKNAVKFREIANEMAALKEQRERISAQLQNNQAAQKHVHTIAAVLDQEDHHLTQWDEEMIRQLVHTVKVISADHIRVYLNDGTEIDQEVGP